MNSKAKSSKVWTGFAVAAGLVAIVTVAQILLSHFLNGRIQVFTLFYPVVLTAAYIGGWAPGAAAIILSVVASMGFSDALGLLHWNDLAGWLALTLFIVV